MLSYFNSLKLYLLNFLSDDMYVISNNILYLFLFKLCNVDIFDFNLKFMDVVLLYILKLSWDKAMITWSRFV